MILRSYLRRNKRKHGSRTIEDRIRDHPRFVMTARVICTRDLLEVQAAKKFLIPWLHVAAELFKPKNFIFTYCL